MVVSSAWRIGKTRKLLQDILNAAGFKGTVIGKTSSSTESHRRGKKIFNWIENARKLYGYDNIDTFVILDDDDDIEPMSAFLVKTTFGVGLTDEHIEKAVRILNPQIVSKSSNLILVSNL